MAPEINNKWFKCGIQVMLHMHKQCICTYINNTGVYLHGVYNDWHQLHQKLVCTYAFSTTTDVSVANSRVYPCHNHVCKKLTSAIPSVLTSSIQAVISTKQTPGCTYMYTIYTTIDISSTDTRVIF